MSVKFVSAILGPEMAAPILWTPGKDVFFLQENLHVHKIPRFFGGGGGILVWGGGEGSADFMFMGAGIFLSPFALFCPLLCSFAFALSCAHLRVSASDHFWEAQSKAQVNTLKSQSIIKSRTDFCTFFSRISSKKTPHP